MKNAVCVSSFQRFKEYIYNNIVLYAHLLAQGLGKYEIYISNIVLHWLMKTKIIFMIGTLGLLLTVGVLATPDSQQVFAKGGGAGGPGGGGAGGPGGGGAGGPGGGTGGGGPGGPGGGGTWMGHPWRWRRAHGHWGGWHNGRPGWWWRVWNGHPWWWWHQNNWRGWLPNWGPIPRPYM